MESRRPVVTWVSTLCWVAVGVLGGFGVAGLATVGLLLLALAGVLAAVALLVPALRPPSVPGFLVGLSAAPLYIAWLNRGGPGMVCTTTADATACEDQWSPWPFVATGVLFAAVGVTLLVVAGRHAAARLSAASPDAAGATGRT